MHPIERSFIRENKQYWVAVVRCNVKALREVRRRQSVLENNIEDQKDKMSNEQHAYRKELKESIITHKKAINVGLQRRHTGFGLIRTPVVEAKKLIGFYRALQNINLQSENAEFKGTVIERALGVIQKSIFDEAQSEALCGLDNGLLIKRIIAMLNCFERYDGDLYYLQVKTQQLAEMLTWQVKDSGYRMPTYFISPT
jgi:hypothetical protein